MSEASCPSCGAFTRGSRFCGSCGLDLTAPARASVFAPVVYVEPGTHGPGAILNGRYRVVGRLATGSMGTVYLVEDVGSGARLALKEMRAGNDSPEVKGEAEAWFRREGQTLMSLTHPAIPRIHDVFVESGRHCLVMDLVEGRTLEELLLMYGQPGLPEAQAVGWADQILDVLSYLHGRAEPVIFRDLKPSNIMITQMGQVRLIDFGVARAIAPQVMGTAIGTPGYAAPEQYQGLAEPASDIYGLGATLHHVLTGRDPRKGRPFDFAPVWSVEPRISPPVAAAVDTALALDPRARHQSAAEMTQALHAWQPPVAAWSYGMAPQVSFPPPYTGMQAPPGAMYGMAPYPQMTGGLSPMPPPGALGPVGGVPAPHSGRLMAGGAAICGVVSTFVPWYTMSVDGFDANFSISVNGWHGWGFLAGMAFMAGAVLSAVPAHLSVSQGSASPLVDRGQVMIASGGLAAMTIVGFMLTEGATLGAGGMFGVYGVVDAGAWFALLCAVMMFVGGLAMVRQGRQRP